MARLFRRSHPRATCLRFEAISLGCSRCRGVGEKCQKCVSRLWRVRTFDLETIPRMRLFTAEMVIKVEVNGGMAHTSLRQAYDGQPKILVWLGIERAHAHSGIFVRTCQPVDARLFQNNPIDRVLCPQFLKIRNPKLFPATLRIHLLLPLLGQRWKHADCAAIL